MQSPRAIGLLFLVLLVCGGAALWFVYGTRDPGIAPPPAEAAPHAPNELAKVAVGDGPASAAHESGAVATDATADAALRTAAADVADGPAIIGRAVDRTGKPVADVEVLCAPGMGFAPDFENLDLAAADLFEDGEDPMDPMAMTYRTERDLRERVATRSDAEGRFRIRAKGTSRVVGLRLLARGYELLDRTAQRPDQQDVDLGDLTLVRGAVVAGRVVDARGRPVAAASVSALLEMEKNIPAGFDFNMPGLEALDDQKPGQAVRSDAEGRFELAHVTPGDVVLRVRHRDYPMLRHADLQVAPGQELRDVVLTMPRTAEISGRVSGLPADRTGLVVMAAAKPEANATPAAGMMAMFGDMSDMLADAGMLFADRQTELAADGAFTLRGLYAERGYRVWVAHAGKGFGGNGLCSERKEVASGSIGVELHFESGATVTFQVVAADDGAPIERLWVKNAFSGGGGLDFGGRMPGGVARDYPAGKVTLTGLRPKKGQKLDLTIRALGFAETDRKDVELPATGALDLGTIRLTAVPVLAVTVVDAADGRPIARAKVRLGENQSARARMPAFLRGLGGDGPDAGVTDRDGHCRLNRGTGEAELTVETKDYAPFTATIAASDARTVEHTARLLVGGLATVTVVDPKGQPVAQATVEHRLPDGSDGRGKTDADGVARFAHLAPGKHAFRLAEPGGAGGPFGFAMRMAGQGKSGDEHWLEAEVADGATVPLTLTKAPTAILHGVVRENGRPLADARVAFVEGPGSEATAPDEIAGQVVGEMLGQFGGGSKQQDKSGDDGSYRLAELPPGQHRLRITHKQRALPSEMSVTLREGDNLFDVELDMTTLRGVVRDPDGQPVEGARVTVQVVKADEDGNDAMAEGISQMLPGFNPGGGGTIKTDETGAFELRGVAPGAPLRVKATAKGFAPAAATATVDAGQVKEGVEVRLGKAGRIKISLADAPPFAAVSARLAGEDASDVAPVVQMLRKGKATLDGLRPGSWVVKVEGPGRNGANEETALEKTVTVVAGETAEVDFP